MPNSEITTAFWEVKSLEEMSREEWESLCDGCAKCCLVKLEDEDSGELVYTDIACQLLDTESCRCQNYLNRRNLVPGCAVLSPETVNEFSWLPVTCAYRRLAEGKGLPEWHPLRVGEHDSTHEAGMSVSGRVLSETQVTDDWEDHIIRWVHI